MRSTLSKVKRVATAFAVAVLITAYVPGVAQALAVAICASWSVIALVLLAPLAHRFRPRLLVAGGHALRVARAVGPWLSPCPALARWRGVQGTGRPVHGLSPISLPSTRWLR